MGAASFGRITQVLLAGLDLLLVGLVVLAVAVAAAQRGPWLMAGVGAAFLAVYAVGRVTIRTDRAAVDAPRGRLWPNGSWIACLIVGWAALLILSPAGLWVAFPLMLIELHTLGPRWGVAAVVLTTAMAIGQGLATAAPPTIGVALGPLIGAAVAIAVLLGLEAFAREVARRQELLDELTEARAWLAEAEVERAVHAERERMAREIHDTLAQGFAGIDLLLRAAEPQLRTGPAADLVARAAETARENLTEARRVVHQLAPDDLAHQPLAEAIARTARRVAEHGTTTANVQVAGTPRPLPMATEAALLRIAQSALANVVQHARATTVTVGLDYRADEVSLTVTDNGIGFDPDAPPDSAGGFGLRSMAARVAQLGGRFAVTREEGTRVAVTVPASSAPTSTAPATAAPSATAHGGDR